MRLFIVLTSLFFLMGCSRSTHTPDGQPPDKHLMVLADISTPAEQAYATELVDGLTRKTRRYGTLSLDRFQGQTTVVDYSGDSSPQVMDEYLAYRLSEVLPSTDAALLAAISRVSQYAHDMKATEQLTAIILTAGTQDPATIKEFTSIISTLPSSGNITIYIAGVKARNVTTLTPAFQSMPANARVVGRLHTDLRMLLQSL